MPLENTPQPSLPRTLLRDHAFTVLYDAIFDGTLAPGELLREDKLGAWLSMSKSPIRHALLRLEELGLVELESGKPARVTEIDYQKMNHTVLISGELNAYITGRVLADLTDADVRKLDQIVVQMKAGLAAESLGSFGPLLRDYFLVFEDAYPNRVLAAQLRVLSQAVARLYEPREYFPGPQAVVDGVAHVQEAVRERDRDEVVRRVALLYAPAHQAFREKFREVASTDE